MPNTTRTTTFHIKHFFRRFPAWPYVVKWLLIGMLLGCLIGSASAGFLVSLQWVTHYRETHTWLIALLPVAGLLIGLLYHYWGKGVAAGNNLLIGAIHGQPKPIPFRMAPFVYIGTLATHLFGGSAGREGTALQMAGGIADQLTKPLRLTPDNRSTLLMAAIAAGFGSVFGTPLAGAVFALELAFTGRVTYKAIWPVFISAAFANMVTDMWHVQHTHYNAGPIPAINVLYVLYAVVAGMVFGICAACFSKSTHYAGKWFTQAIAYAPLRAFAGGIVVVLMVGLIGTKYIGLGIPVIQQALQVQLPPYDFILKMLFTIITLSAGFKGGEVTPLFFIGAALGNCLSYVMPMPVGLMSAMGFVAVFAGATNTPVACTFMAMELFGSACGIYAGLACVTAYLFSGHTSIYTQQQIGIPKHRRYSHYAGKMFKDL
jgi:H+/Cl- antiporter ClcA